MRSEAPERQGAGGNTATLGISWAPAAPSRLCTKAWLCALGVVSCVCEAGLEDQWAQGTGQEQCPGSGPGAPWKGDRGADVWKPLAWQHAAVLRTLSSRQSPVSPAIIFKAEAAESMAPTRVREVTRETFPKRGPVGPRGPGPAPLKETENSPQPLTWRRQVCRVWPGNRRP